MVSRDAVRGELSVAPPAVGLTESEFDALLDRLITRETTRVEDAISVTLGDEQTTAETSRPRHLAGHLLPLDNRPVRSVNSVSVSTGRVGGPTVSADEIDIRDGAALELLPSARRERWPTERRSISVTYSHGYPSGQEPEPIAGAIIGLVRQAVQEIDADGIESESVSGHSVDYEMPGAVLARHLNRAKRFDEPEIYGGVNTV